MGLWQALAVLAALAALAALVALAALAALAALGPLCKNIARALGPLQAPCKNIRAVARVARTFYVTQFLCHEHCIYTVAHSCIAGNGDFNGLKLFPDKGPNILRKIDPS